MKYWVVKAAVIKGSQYVAVLKQALRIYHAVEKQTKRRSYIRSRYFKQKIFLIEFFEHLKQKNPKDRQRRLRYFACALELIKVSAYIPEVYQPPKKNNAVWYRLYGQTKEKELFCVQLRADSKGNLFFMSVFPYKEKD